MSDLEVLQAGGMIPTTAKLGKDEAVDTVVARAYAHAVLPGRTVIRLTAQSVAAGDDLEMATLGFSPGEDRGAVGKERRRPLGFPGWALVHDPKNARFALEVVKEFKKHARKARSKPGHAKDGIDAIAAKLGRSAPHFLPSFYEEAGRVFIEHGAVSYAATMFGKAREAEAVHSLEVDEQHRVDGFLEFALAGAVTTKALTQYAKDLRAHHEPKVAYAHFRQLCVQRTLGGMPPWSGMAKELAALAKAAKLDADAEDAALIAEIIESPALGKAASEFWRAYAAPIAALGKANPKARGAILEMFPTGSTDNPELDEAWLDLLEASGAIEALITDAAPPEARPSAGRAAWFDKLTSHLARSWRDATISARAFELLRRMAPMLIADGTPVTCAGRYDRVDLDLCELALELGVPVAPPANARLDVEEWAKHASEPERGRDPVRCAAHPAIGPLLSASVANELGDEPFDSASRGKAGFREAKRAWLETTIRQAEQGGIPRLEETIATIDAKVKAETFAELPDLHARFAALDPALALARTLRIGIIDELGWPALEAVAAELDPEGKAEITLHGGPPAVVLVSKTRAIAVGPAGKLGEHDLVIPRKHELVTIRYIGGEFLVVLKESYKTRAYWSRAPHDVFESDASTWHLPAIVSRAVVLPDGAWLEAAPIRPGDRKLALGAKLSAYDGTTAWITEWKDGEHRWREIAATGELGRTSWPAFIEAGIAAEWRIDAASYLLPAPHASSPLGTANGFVGARVRYQGATMQAPSHRDVTMIDGTSWQAPPAATMIGAPARAGAADVRAIGLVRFPGSDEPRPLVEDARWREGVTVTILSADARLRGSKISTGDLRYLRGQVAPLPATLWHHLMVRDEAGSRRLRATSDADARALIAGVPVETTTPPGVRHPPPSDVTQGVLPELTHPRLRTGVTGLAVMATELGLWRDRLAVQRAPATAVTPSAGGGHDEPVLLEAFAGWIEASWATAGRAWAQIDRTAELFASRDRSNRTVTALPAATFDWMSFAVARWSLAFVATAIGTPAGRRRAVAELLDHLVRVLPPVERLRVYRAHGRLELGAIDRDRFALQWRDGNAYAVKGLGWRGDQFRILEYAPEGTFRGLPGLTPDGGSTGARGPTVDDAAAVLAAVAEGTTTWSAAAAARLAELTGLTPSEASFLLAGCPNASDRSANFLDKQLREQLGLKAVQAAIARDAMLTIPLYDRIRVIDEAASAGVAALLGPAMVDRLAAAWNRIVGPRIAIPEELIADADRELQTKLAPSAALAMIGNAAESPQLTTDGIFAFGGTCDVIRAGKPEPLVGQTGLDDPTPVFDVATLGAVVTYVPFLYAELPVGNALREQAAIAHELVLERLANPALWLHEGTHYMTEEGAAAMDRVLDGLGGELLTGLEDGITARRLPGAVIQRAHLRAALVLHPATLDAKAVTTIRHLAPSMISPWGLSAWQALEYARSADLAAIVARIRTTPVPAGGWEQNPLASVPKLVDRAARHLGISQAAAALYLQYLTLLWPTPKNLARWNAWTPRQLEAANAELVGRELILEAKRERAQRTSFLPGGWEALRSPHPPIESWKVPLYGTRSVSGAPMPYLPRFLATAPFHLLFERAWARIDDGDIPRYEEVKR